MKDYRIRSGATVTKPVSSFVYRLRLLTNYVTTKSYRYENYQRGKRSRHPNPSRLPITSHFLTFPLSHLLLSLTLLFTVHCSLFTDFVWAQPTQIVSVSPSRGALGIKIDTFIRITFNKEMNKESVEKNFIISPEIRGEFSWERNALIFRPEKELLPSSLYTISIGSPVKDQEGSPLIISYFKTVDQILYLNRNNIWVANADGSGRRNLTGREGSYFRPLWLKGNERIIFEMDSDLWIMNRAGSDKRPLTTGGAVVSHEFLPSPDGKKIAFLSKDGEIRVVDIEQGIEARVFSPEVPKKSNLGLGCPFAWSPDGNYLLYNRLSKKRILDIWLTDALGKEAKPLTKNRRESNDWGFKFSPDGKKITYTIEGALYTMDNDGSNQERVSGDTELNEDKFSFSPDGARIVFLSNYNIWTVRTAGSDLRQLTEGNNSNYPSWSATGQKIVFTKLDEEKNTNDIWMMNGEGKNQNPLTENRIVSGPVEFSGNGDYLSFYSIEGTEYYFWIMNTNGTGKQILSSGKERPIQRPSLYPWSR